MKTAADLVIDSKSNAGSSSIIYHMAHAGDWQNAVDASCAYAGSSDDLRDGFIHFSTATQIVVSAARHRAGQSDLLLIAVAATDLGDALKWEASRGGTLFPHLYCTLDPALARGAVPLPWDAARQAHIFPDGFPDSLSDNFSGNFSGSVLQETSA